MNTSSYLVPKAASDEPDVEESDTSTSTAESFLLCQTSIAFGFALVSIVVRIADFLSFRSNFSVKRNGLEPLVNRLLLLLLFKNNGEASNNLQ